MQLYCILCQKDGTHTFDQLNTQAEVSISRVPLQVALNWTLCKGALPIPGAKSAAQVTEIAGALGWRLGEGQVAELDRVSAKIPSSTGAPFEKW